MSLAAIEEKHALLERQLAAGELAVRQKEADLGKTLAALETKTNGRRAALQRQPSTTIGFTETFSVA